MLPNDTNLLGNLLGGTLMHWVDIIAAIAAIRHSESAVVTAAVDSLDFKKSIPLGHIVTLKAKVTWVGNTSMEVKVDVYKENEHNPKKELTNSAFLVFVAQDTEGKKKKVPELILISEEEREEFKRGIQRKQLRIARK